MTCSARGLLASLLLGSVLALAGCGDDPAPRSDGGSPPADMGSGGTDTGPPPADTGPVPTDAGPAVDAGPDDACNVASDCAWGEIDHEITRREDCLCLFGCPSIPQSRATVDRRRAQYSMFCDPNTDGMGNPCPVDDCIAPPPLECRAGVCAP